LAIIKTGIETGTVCNGGRTALIEACDRELSDVALALIATGSSNCGAISKKYNQTALSQTCHLLMTDVALAIIATGDSNCSKFTRVNENTPLILACMFGLSDVALALIGTGEANIEHVNKAGNTAMTHASKNNMFDVMTAIISVCKNRVTVKAAHEKQKSIDAMYSACKNYNTDAALRIIASDWNYYDHITVLENTILMHACQFKSNDIALAIIASDKFSNYKQINKDRDTALTIAINNDMTEVALAITKKIYG
jgi:hypothetical protein